VDSQDVGEASEANISYCFMMDGRSIECVFSPRHLSVTVYGIVQGVGFRPFVCNLASELRLSGWVRNESSLVRIEVQGNQAVVDEFVERLRRDAPVQSRIDAIEIRDLPLVNAGEHAIQQGAFVILPSEERLSPRPAIPADLATCEQCLAEIRDPEQRRHGYPFTNCTNCGPRWSIIEAMPYDRPNTSMASFTMCASCRAEYENPADRRFHAQPIACPHCGPLLQLLDSQGKEIAAAQAALDQAVNAILSGRIVALKGLGGFQLLADATNSETVALLRDRKRRPDRPFAVMMPTLGDVRNYCDVSEEEAHELESHRAPIVLLKQVRVSPLSSCLSPCVAPGNPCLGVMLPYTPLHHLLMAAVRRPIICTSGNLSEEPMVIDAKEAVMRLGSIADVLLTHDRPIVRPVDDSIVRFVSVGRQVLRRARGFAPLPLEVPCPSEQVPTILAVGGHLKNAVAVLLGGGRESRGASCSDKPPIASVPVVMSSHIGDLDSVSSVEVFRRAADDVLKFFRAEPDVVACDMHPDYASTRHAEQLAGQWDVPLVRVQHHHAHVAACMAEHQLQGPVLGFAWDGTGYGTDGTIWGGEVLICEEAGFRRAAHLRTFALPGGDRAAREPRRSALAVLFELFEADAVERVAKLFRKNELEALALMLRRRIHAPRTSSVGRLFDAVAALCDLPSVISFEGHAAMALEFAADESEQSAYAMSLSRKDAEGALEIDWEPTIRSILADRAAGMSAGGVSAKFHNGLAEMAVTVARNLDTSQRMPVVLAGGCFQNRLLFERVAARLSDAGFRVYNQQETPPGDGGIALGQIYVALHQR